MNEIETIEAIKTRYKGRDYRSRLEARIAVFLDVIGAEYEYEPKYFDLGFGVRYSPDFLVHGVNGRCSGDLWIEAKGVLRERDIWKIDHFQQPIIVINSIPAPQNYREWQRDRFQQNPYFFSCQHIDGDCFGAVLCAGYYGGLVVDDENYNFSDFVSHEKTVDAFRTARIINFETTY